MIKLYQRLSINFATLLVLAVPKLVSASGSLGVVQDGDALYLSTQEATNSATKSASAQGDVVLFKGYAETLGGLITSILTFVMLISSLLVLFQLISAGFQWLTSGGDKGKTDEARSKIVAAVVGIIIVAAAWAVFLVVLKFLGFTSYDDLFANVSPIS